MNSKRVLVLSTLLAIVAGCGTGQRKPSDIVTLSFAGIVNCSSTPGRGRQINVRKTALGTLESFAIPAGKVLVIESMNVYLAGGPTDQDASIQLIVGEQTVWSGYKTRGPGPFVGRMTVGPSFSSGVVVKPGVEICVRSNEFTSDDDLPIGVNLYGYLTDDDQS